MGLDVDQAITQLHDFVTMVCHCSTQDPGTQDDLFQECMIVVVDLTLKYQGKPLEEFIKIAKQAVRNKLTSMARMRRVYDRHQKAAAKPDRYESKHEDSACSKEALAFVRSRLQETEQEILDLTARGLSFSDVQRVTGRGKTAVWRSMKKIEEIVEDHGWHELFRPIDRLLLEEGDAIPKAKVLED